MITFADVFFYSPPPASSKRPRTKRTRSKTEADQLPVVVKLTEKFPPAWVAVAINVMKDLEKGAPLRRFVAEMGEGSEIDVSYRKKGHGYGRLYPDGALSLGGLLKGVRGILCHSTMLDIDLSNAHPAILLGLCEKLSIPAKELSLYVNNREEFIAKTKLSRDDAKRSFLTAIFNGETPAVELRNEIRLIARILRDRFRDKFDIVTAGKKNPSGTFMHYVLSDEEVTILMEMIEFLKADGWVIAALIHDGLVVYKRKDKERPSFDDMQAHVMQKTGYNIPVSIKPWDLTLVNQQQ